MINRNDLGPSNRSRYQRRRATPPPVNNSVRRTYDLLRSTLPSLEPDALLVEEDLIKSLSASRNTVRVVLQLLAAQGLLKRGPKVGTTVGSAMVLPVSRLINLGEAGKKPTIHTRLLESVVIPAPAAIRRRLELAEGARVALIEALLSDDTEPLAVSVSYVSLPENYERRIKSAEIVAILEEDLNVSVGESDALIAALVADAQTAEQLQIDEGAPVLFLEDLLRDTDGMPRALSQLRYRADRVTFSATACREPAEEQ